MVRHRWMCVGVVGWMGLVGSALGQSPMPPGVYVHAVACWERVPLANEYHPEMSSVAVSGAVGILTAAATQLDGDIRAYDSSIFSNSYGAVSASSYRIQVWRKKSSVEVGEIEVSGAIDMKATVDLVNPDCAASAVGKLVVVVDTDAGVLVNEKAEVALNMQTTPLSLGTVSPSFQSFQFGVPMPLPSAGVGKTPASDSKPLAAVKCPVQRVTIMALAMGSLTASAWGWTLDPAESAANIKGWSSVNVTLLCHTSCP